MSVPYVKMESTKIWVIGNFAWTLTLQYTLKTGSFISGLLNFEWPTQRPVRLCPSIAIEPKIAHKPGDGSPCYAAGYLDSRWAAWRGLVALATEYHHLNDLMIIVNYACRIAQLKGIMTILVCALWAGGQILHAIWATHHKINKY